MRLGSTTAATHLVEGQRIRHPSRGLGTIVHVSPGVREVRFDDPAQDLWKHGVRTNREFKTHSFGKLEAITEADQGRGHHSVMGSLMVLKAARIFRQKSGHDSRRSKDND